MNIRRQVLVSAGAVGVMLAAAGWGYGRLPAQIAVRWDIHGAPAGFLDRGLALLIIPAISLALSVLFALAPDRAPPRSRLERSGAAWTAVWMAALAALLCGQGLLVAANLGAPLDVPRLCALCVAAMGFIVGNWLGKVRYNLLFGIRTPWTLADERVWDKTHRFVGRLLVLASLGLASAGLAIQTSPQSGLLFCGLTIACAAGPVLAGVIYSAFIARPGEPIRNGS